VQFVTAVFSGVINRVKAVVSAAVIKSQTIFHNEDLQGHFYW
jgi:hypothetical protein